MRLRTRPPLLTYLLKFCVKHWVIGCRCVQVVCWVPPTPPRNTSFACLRLVVFVCARRSCLGAL